MGDIKIDRMKRIEDCKGKFKEILGNDEIINLAKKEKIPHYILTHPITKEKEFLFVPSEINGWLEDNHIRRNECNNPSYNFIYFDKEKHKANKNIPIELNNIKELYSLPRDYIITPSGIYFLCKGGKIKYIGQAKCITDRVLNHIREAKKDFEEIFYIQAPINKLTELEGALIKHFRPKYNKTHFSLKSYKEENIINKLYNYGKKQERY
jgi:hypothetical protein